VGSLQGERRLIIRRVLQKDNERRRATLGIALGLGVGEVRSRREEWSETVVLLVHKSIWRGESQGQTVSCVVIEVSEMYILDVFVTKIIFEGLTSTVAFIATLLFMHHCI
jgi:hypothetical protein